MIFVSRTGSCAKIVAVSSVKGVTTKGFSEKDPLAAGFFRKFKLTNEQMSDLMGYLANDTVSEAEGAKMWKDKNQELVEGWFE